MRPVAPLSKCSMTVVVSSEGPGMLRAVTQRTSRTRPANSIMWSSECTPTAVSAPPGASSGAARQLSGGMNWPVLVVCCATMETTVPSRPSRRRRRISTTDGWKRRLKPTASTTPALRAASTAASRAAAVERDRLLDVDVLAGGGRRQDLLARAGCAGWRAPPRRRRGRRGFAHSCRRAVWPGRGRSLPPSRACGYGRRRTGCRRSCPAPT